ncbi:hypothetical protein VIGAN_03135000, partial [Vigna angularis var. angularis]
QINFLFLNSMAQNNPTLFYFLTTPFLLSYPTLHITIHLSLHITFHIIYLFHLFFPPHFLINFYIPTFLIIPLTFF